MRPVDATDYNRLRDAVVHARPAELLSRLQSQPGGIAQVLDDVFAGMADSFDPDAAQGQHAAVLYVLTADGQSWSYAVEVADGACTIRQGSVDKPRLTLRASVVDFLRVVTEDLGSVAAVMTGRLRLTGDLTFARHLERWFPRPE